ncbi:MAG TPA: pyridoxamine 5'-phosphate oxidase family protein [Euzebyales bacterium]|nr:pyridoxamine 5'-phosphate oxidase family protein [Euzebyales bacterium]
MSIDVTHPATRMGDLTVDACQALLRSCSLGRLAFIAGGRPRLVPLNYGVDGGDIVLRIERGALRDAVFEQHVTFEVDDHDPATASGWSVIVDGVAEEIWRTSELARVRSLGLRPWAPGNRDHYVRIAPTAISGRRIG